MHAFPRCLPFALLLLKEQGDIGIVGHLNDQIHGYTHTRHDWSAAVIGDSYQC